MQGGSWIHTIQADRNGESALDLAIKTTLFRRKKGGKGSRQGPEAHSTERYRPGTRLERGRGLRSSGRKRSFAAGWGGMVSLSRLCKLQKAWTCKNQDQKGRKKLIIGGFLKKNGKKESRESSNRVPRVLAKGAEEGNPRKTVFLRGQGRGKSWGVPPVGYFRFSLPRRTGGRDTLFWRWRKSDQVLLD